jgi:hypothetical protein
MNQKLKEVFRGKVVNKAHTINTSKAGRREVMKGIGKAHSRCVAR